MRNHSVSIIVPSFNGAQKLPNLLASLEQQTFKGFEVIIVVDGSTDNTREALESRTWRLDMKVVYQENKGRAGAKNTGAKNSQNELLIFIDDDMEMTNQAISEHYEFHKTNKKIILGGTALTKPVPQISDFELFKAHIDKKRLLRLPKKGVVSIENLYLTAANFSITKNNFNLIGSFDENLFDQEDFDLAIRSIESGFTIYLDQNLTGWHKDNITIESYIKRQLEYKMATEKTLKLKPHYEKYYRRRIVNTNIWEKSVYSIFANSLFRKITKLKIFEYLPLNIRFKFYEYSIWGYVNYFPNRIK